MHADLETRAMADAIAEGVLECRPWGNAHSPCSDLANANRLKHHFGDHLLYVDGIGWHTWGPPWKLDELGARRIAHGLGRLIAEEAAAMAPWVAASKDGAERKIREQAMEARFRFATASEQASAVRATLHMAQPMLCCRADELDADPDLLGLPNGVLDLRNWKRREHQQNDYITKTAGAEIDFAADAPTWRKFLADIMADDAELLDYIQRLAGYSLTGHRGEHLLPILFGCGANGKSTFLSTMQALLGDYAGTAAPSLLIAKGGNEHPTALADLQGKRLVVVSETGEAGRLNEEVAKMLTGGDTITARRMRQDFYQFKPTHLLMLQTNHRPRVAGTDEGIWRRLRLLPFVVTIPPEMRDARLVDKLRAELPGVLSWALEGLKKYRANGFNTPASVKAATADYRSSSDAIGAFISECCRENPFFTVPASDLYKAYVEWCENSGERPRPQRDFGMRLSERGFDAEKGTGGKRRWRGIGLADSGTSGGSGGGLGLVHARNISQAAHTRSTATSATNATAYRAAKDGEEAA
ncbi:DNA primase family protein [Tahibacter harae]|uniref:Phage/plasmid primase, P4 family n=1 Tax=Tahibacter harae TaxID=2963937 RepID=A0ABT1QQX0_9GAMM|nr:phage/plasmid primase, P4 family [Tahibacter harae]MCQ4164698.1 phage/plasmid primase, P4 family [Tahibacter harae]